MRSHGNGHHAPIEETLAFLSPYRPPGNFTNLFIASGVTSTITPTILNIEFDSSSGAQAQPIALLKAGTYVGETHVFVWYGWGNLNTPPLIQGAAGVLMMPFSGMAQSGAAGLVNSSTIPTQGATYTLQWNGLFWVSR